MNTCAFGRQNGGMAQISIREHSPLSQNDGREPRPLEPKWLLIPLCLYYMCFLICARGFTGGCTFNKKTNDVTCQLVCIKIHSVIYIKN